VQALQDYDFDLHVIHCHGDVERDNDWPDGRASIHVRRPARWHLLPNLLMAIRRMRETLQDIHPDVVNAHSSHYAVAPLSLGLPTVVTLHGVVQREAEIYNRSPYDWARYALLRLFDRYTLPRVREIIAISPYVHNVYAPMTRAHWHEIANPVADDFFAVPTDRQISGRILYVGSITPLKNVEMLLDALAFIPKAQLHLAGRITDTRYAMRLHARSTRADIAGRVVFRGLLCHADLLQAYAEASVVVLPSWQEVAPLAMIEAMAAGKAVVATRVGGIPHLIEHGRTGLLVDPNDTTGLATSIGAILNDARLRADLGQAARQYAHQHHDARLIAAHYAEVLRQVGKGNG
jgi:glycosyltransferase involved in cell wall biosynthesis